jgi:hypothetical protein
LFGFFARHNSSSVNYWCRLFQMLFSINIINNRCRLFGRLLSIAGMVSRVSNGSR